MPRQAKETRENFEAGKVDGWGAGEWGSVVRVFAESGKLKIRYRPADSSNAKQRTLFAADSPELRKRAASIAVKKSEDIRRGVVAEEEEAEDPGEDGGAEDLTVERAVLLYMRRIPGFTDDVLDMKASKIRDWYEALPDDAKTVAEWTVIGDVYGFRRLFTDDRFARDRLVEDLEPADATSYVADYVAGGSSKQTAVNDTDRLSCAFNYVMQQHRRSVGLTFNPIEGRKVDREKPDIDEYTTEEGLKMLKAAPELAKKGQWHILVVTGIATSGRRIGSIRALTVNDHDFEEGTVTWRSDTAKGENYGRGDSVRPMTRRHREAVEWAMEHHPNPAGPGYPILWRSGGISQAHQADPTKPVPYSTVWRQLQRLEELAGVDHVDGRGFHGWRRWVVTRLADELGDGVVSEFVDMTVETVRGHSYKKVQEATMKKAADHLDQLASGSDSEEDKTP